MRRSNFQGNIHIINFPAWTAAADLAELFDDYGLVLGAEIKPIESDGGDLRLGIVAIAPDSAADKAIEALQGHVIGGQKLKLRRPKPQPPRERKAPRPPRPANDRPHFDRPHAHLERPQMERSADGYASEAAEYFQAANVAPPRKVIVEYRGRRNRARV